MQCLQTPEHCLRAQELLDATTTQAGAPRRRAAAGRKWYFEKLEVAAIRCNLTMVPQAGARDDSAALGARCRALPVQQRAGAAGGLQGSLAAASLHTAVGLLQEQCVHPTSLGPADGLLTATASRST